VAVLLAWSMLLAIGAALMVHPQLGSTIMNSNKETPADFITAIRTPRKLTTFFRFPEYSVSRSLLDASCIA
jgi:hypothetical protein